MPQLPIKDIGPCVVVWDYDIDPLEPVNQVCITPYLGTVALRGTDTISDVQEEGYGDAPVDGVFAGTVMELDVPMTRSKLTQLAVSIAYEDMGSVADPLLTLKNIAGCDMFANAKGIVIAPICNNCVDNSETGKAAWTHIFKAHPYRDFELTWDRSGQRIHMVKFKIFPNILGAEACESDYLTEGMPITANTIDCDDICTKL